MAMNEVLRILMERDGLSEDEAREEIGECVDALCNRDFEAINDYLGLEDDYIFDLLQTNYVY